MPGASRSRSSRRQAGSVQRVVALLLLVGSCLTPSFPSAGATDVEGRISADVTWMVAESPYVLVGDLTIEDGAKLTIEAGVSVLANSRTPTIGIYVEGGLVINGTAGTPVVFEPGNPTPSRGEWRGIQVNLTGWINARHARISFAEDGIRARGSCIFPNPPVRPQVFLNDTRIADSGYAGLQIESSCSALVKNATFIRNADYGIRLDEATNLTLVDSNVTSSRIGIGGLGATDLFVARTAVHNSSDDTFTEGVNLVDARNVTLSEVTVVDIRPAPTSGQGTGIALEDCENVTVVDSLVARNKGPGIRIGEGPNVTVLRSRVLDNDRTGIAMGPGVLVDDSIVQGNEIGVDYTGSAEGPPGVIRDSSVAFSRIWGVAMYSGTARLEGLNFTGNGGATEGGNLVQYWNLLIRVSAPGTTVEFFTLQVTDQHGRPFGSDSMIEGNWTRLSLPQYEVRQDGLNITHAPYAVVVGIPGRSRTTLVTLDRDTVLSIEFRSPDRTSLLLAIALLVGIIVLVMALVVRARKRRRSAASDKEGRGPPPSVP